MQTESIEDLEGAVERKQYQLKKLRERRDFSTKVCQYLRQKPGVPASEYTKFLGDYWLSGCPDNKTRQSYRPMSVSETKAWSASV
jgi:hypothetical protein